MGRSKAKFKRVDITKPLVQPSNKVNTIAVEAAPHKFIDPTEEEGLKPVQDVKDVLALFDRDEPNSSVEVGQSWHQKRYHNVSGWMNAHVEGYFNEGTPSTVIDDDHNAENDAASKPCRGGGEFPEHFTGVDSQIASLSALVKANSAPSFTVTGSMESTETSLQRLISMQESRKASGPVPLPRPHDSTTLARLLPPQPGGSGTTPGEALLPDRFADLEAMMRTPNRHSDSPIRTPEEEAPGGLSLGKPVVAPRTGPGVGFGSAASLGGTAHGPVPTPRVPSCVTACVTPRGPSCVTPSLPSRVPCGVPSGVAPPEAVLGDGLSSSESFYHPQQWLSLASPLSLHLRPVPESGMGSIDAASSRGGHGHPVESVSSPAVQSILIRELIGSEEDTDSNRASTEVTTVTNENHHFVNIPPAGMSKPLIQNSPPFPSAAEGFSTMAINPSMFADKWAASDPFLVMSLPPPSSRPQVANNDSIEKLMSLMISDE
ncbi:unnamed protein product [Phytomonas sp. EM1]|nr:unnamed protein product [Phytomonas sp. EM1]|eukprot:CCW59566.1 unnamed protein product [Phytomonas sp. isolate EM1]